MKVAACAQFCFLLIFFFVFFFNQGHSRTDILTGYQLTMAVPSQYNEGFIGRAYLIETNRLMPPNFKAALAVEATDGKFSCSLQVFLGEFKVWSSGHFSRFFTADKCVLELTADGDLRIKGPTGRVGWRAGTSGQGVEKLRLLENGNLGLFDASESIKWQSFNFPTDVMLWNQSLTVATYLTSFPKNSTSYYYTFEIEDQKLALYLNSPKFKYSYWEYKPSNSITKNISFIKLGSRGLNIYDKKGKKIGRIPSQTVEHPLRFLALWNKTGNMGLYSYSPAKGSFESSFRAINNTCDLPLACKPYGICTKSNSCSCIRVEMENEGMKNSKCGDEEISSKYCGKTDKVEMVELEGISSVLRDDGVKRLMNMSKEECSDLCLGDCKCAAALYLEDEKKECYLYDVVMGVKEIEKGKMGYLSYLVKVEKGSELGNDDDDKSNLKKWVIVVVSIVDGFIIVIVCVVVRYYFIKWRRKNLMDTNTHS